MQHLKKKRYKLKPISLIVIVMILACVAIIYLFTQSVLDVSTNNVLSSAQVVSVSYSSVISNSQNDISSVSVSSSISSNTASVLSSDAVSEYSAVSSVKQIPSSIVQSSYDVVSDESKFENYDVSSQEITSVAESNTNFVSADGLPDGNLSDWNLILLNPSDGNMISQELDIQKTKFDSQYIDSRAADSYKAMYDSAKKSGITLYLRSGYRSMKTQGVNYNASVQRLLKQGFAKDEAIRQTNLYYTVPGHSEHHSGLAFDIITPEYHQDVYTLNEKFAATDAYTWLKSNCAEYGFILRYPKEKYDITTINFEPWHYRYVGVEHAKYIMSNEICFEEYIDLLRQAGR